MFNLAFVGSLVGLLFTPSALAITPATAVSTPALAAARAVAPAAVTPAGMMTVEVVTVNGSGCPAGTASVSASSDNTSFTVTYSDFVVQAGGAARPIDFRKNCQLVLQVSVPQGFTYAVARADYAGTAALTSGATGTQLAGYYFQGSSDTVRPSHSFTGPYFGAWHTSDVTDVAALVYAPCGQQVNLNVNAELRVLAGSADQTSEMTMGSVRGSLQTLYSLSWKSCP